MSKTFTQAEVLELLHQLRRDVLETRSRKSAADCFTDAIEQIEHPHLCAWGGSPWALPNSTGERFYCFSLYPRFDVDFRARHCGGDWIITVKGTEFKGTVASELEARRTIEAFLVEKQLVPATVEFREPEFCE